MAVLHKLQTGLDVNVKFTGVRVFEYTPECIVFDLLDIPLYHGWLVDPQVRWTLLITAVSLFTSLKPNLFCCALSILNMSLFEFAMNTEIFYQTEENVVFQFLSSFYSVAHDRETKTYRLTGVSFGNSGNLDEIHLWCGNGLVPEFSWTIQKSSLHSSRSFSMNCSSLDFFFLSL